MITQTGTESELIYRQQAIDALDSEITITGRTNAEAVIGYVRLVKDRLERLPSAESEIIRCYECKWYEASIMGNPWGVCCHSGWIAHQTGHNVDESGWCYRAERRQDGN